VLGRVYGSSCARACVNGSPYARACVWIVLCSGLCEWIAFCSGVCEWIALLMALETPQDEEMAIMRGARSSPSVTTVTPPPPQESLPNTHTRTITLFNNSN